MDLKTISIAIGVLMNVLGLLLIFYYGISPYLKEQGQGPNMIRSAEYYNDKSSPMNKRRKRFNCLAQLGLWFSVVGGLIQCFALFF